MPRTRSDPLVDGGGAQLPHPLTRLIARDQEVAAIVALLRDSTMRLLTLTGPGGVGKTRLAIAAAGEVSEVFVDGVVFVDLAPITNPDLVLDTIGGALGLRDMGAASLRDRLADVLADKRMLLVLDNFEQVVTAGPQVRDLLGVCPRVTFLITSRARLRLSGEREFPVSPLPMSTPTTVEDAEAVGAIRLFTECVRASQLDFRLTAETLPVVAEIVSRVDGLPLAIELAAARIKVLPPAALLERLDQRLPLLGGGARDLPLRQQTMRDTIAWSYDLLNGDEQALFHRLGVFASGFTLAAAVAVSSLQDTASTSADLEVVDGITSLIDHSVLQLTSGPVDDPRYLMLETVREFARDRLAKDGEAAAIQQRHAHFYLAFAEVAEVELAGPRQEDWLNRLEVDHANLRAAMAWSLAHEPEAALRLGMALRLFWRRRGFLSEGISLLQRALATELTSPAARARGHVALASLQNMRGDFADAARNAERARALSESLGDRLGVAEALRRLPVFHLEEWVKSNSPDPEAFARAQAPWAEEVVIRQELGDARGAAWALHNLGIASLVADALDQAAAYMNEALATFEEADDHYALAFVLTNLGRVMAQQGNDARAAQLFRQGMALFQQSRDHWGIGHVLEDCGWLLVRAGQPERGTQLLGAAAAARARDGVQLTMVHARGHERVIDRARTVLGETRFIEAFAAGQAMALHDAYAAATDVLAAAAFPEPAATPSAAEELGLTPRQIEVLRLLAQGMSDREIAETLFLSPRTVGWHVTHLLTRLGVQSRAAAAAAAIRGGLV